MIIMLRILRCSVVFVRHVCVMSHSVGLDITVIGIRENAIRSGMRGCNRRQRRHGHWHDASNARLTGVRHVRRDCHT